MKIQFIFLAALIFLLGLISGFGISNYSNKTIKGSNNCIKAYFFLNPDLNCETKYVIRKTGYAEFKFKIESYINQQKSEGNITEASVYFRDLVDGPWFGIEEDDLFNPASLLKLPIMITVLKSADDNSRILDAKIKISELPKDVDSQYFKSEKQVEIGETHSVNDLMERMIVYSDNRSSALLIQHLYSINAGADPLLITLRDTGTLRSDSDPFEKISVKSYASLFRLLFNASYLSEELSERALKVLSMTKFKKGLDAGIPEDIIIANKFGERQTQEGLSQLHDCGIVYFPKNPYLLCVMTRGGDFDSLAKVIEEISKMTYQEIKSRKL